MQPPFDTVPLYARGLKKIPILLSVAQGCQIVNQSIEHTSSCSVDNDRPGNRKDFCTNAQNPTLCTGFNGTAADSVGESCDGNERSSSGMFCNFFIPAQTGKENAASDESNGRKSSRSGLIRTEECIEVQQQAEKSGTALP